MNTRLSPKRVPVILQGWPGHPALISDEPTLSPAQIRVMLLVAQLGPRATLRRLMRGKSPNGVLPTLRKLQREGRIAYEPHKAGTIVILKPLQWREMEPK